MTIFSGTAGLQSAHCSELHEGSEMWDGWRTEVCKDFRTDKLGSPGGISRTCGIGPRWEGESLFLIRLLGAVRENPVCEGGNLAGLNPDFAVAGEAADETFAGEEERLVAADR